MKRAGVLSVVATLTVGAAVSMGAASPASARDGGAVRSFDVVVYGATPSGVVAAIEAERLGKSAAVVEPSARVGGMVTGGLSATDRGSTTTVIGGVAREFFDRVGTSYGAPTGWYFEPRVATQVMTQMLAEAGVAVFTGQQLAEGAGAVRKSKTVVASFVTTDGNTYSGREFVDASYEGDLMAAAGVSYTTGREAQAQYGETLAGVQPARGFAPAVSGLDPAGSLFPQISTDALGGVGSADNHVQAYNFRITATDVAANRVPFPLPAHYDPHDFALLAAWLPQRQTALGRGLTIRDVVKLSPLPNGKYDMNNFGPFSTDFLNGSTGYPNGSYAQRAAIHQQTLDYDMGLLYFLQNDPAVPAALHQDMAGYGLAADEFTDNGNWPTQLYVREARRMVGTYVLRQQDLFQNRTKSTTIALGAYSVDQHNSYRGVDQSGQVVDEGTVPAPSPAVYAIPYGSITPLATQVTNLLDTGTPSVTHVAWSSVRVEPQLMMLGQAAADAASLAIDGKLKVQSVSYTALRRLLLRRGGILASTQASTTIVDNTDPHGFSTTGTWSAAGAVPGAYGANYLVANGAAGGPATATWTPDLPLNGSYAVYARLPVEGTLSADVSFVVTDATGTATTVHVDEQEADGRVPLGTFAFQAGHGATVTVTSDGSPDPVAVDALEFVH